MTLVEDYSREAVAEVLAILRENHRRMGEFQVTSKAINKIITERFGLPHISGLGSHVVGALVKRGILKFWDRRSGKGMTTIYQVNTFVLMNSGTRGPLVSGT